METTPAPAPLSSGTMLLVASARRNLRQALNHPAFSPERRQRAEQLLSGSTDAACLLKWKALALRECEAWEDATLLREEAQPGPPAHPEYAY
ncbi:hypothetical protein I2I05_19760 [Hymenobacter sp. BT683]|uniref:Uncharacterized protein n=1 Tax=Hymenobacter jeongseonensis TaxID=2791027 RepID=A0ABS0IMP2_9BACT|nr:hypothetical protein [Hymenobacter jeongseonensis]MBF9239639.1 hypothetical protein [Hymenobacter jeongseonensis]